MKWQEKLIIKLCVITNTRRVSGKEEIIVGRIAKWFCDLNRGIKSNKERYR